MAGLGTIINTLAVIVGGLLGMIFGKGLKQRFQDTLMMASAVCVLFIGISGTMQEMLALADGKLTTVGTMMMIGSFTFGSLVGEWLNIEHRMEQFGEWLKAKSGNGGDGGFVNGFVTCSLTICIGAMAVVGSIQDGILGDHSTLMAKAVLDLIIVMIMTASMGKGCIFSAIPIAVFQGTITLLARLIEPIMTEAALANLSLTGSIMIFCVGLNLVWGKKVKVANMLPTLIFAVAWSFLPI